MAASGGDLFVTSYSDYSVSEYATTGAPISAPLITGLNFPAGLAVSGGDLFVSSLGNQTPGSGTIGEYTTSGTAVNASLITGLNRPAGVAVSGSDLFVTNGNAISQYDTSGTTINASLVTGLSAPEDIALATAPEPATWVMLLVGVASLLACGIRRRHP